ncbi:MAG: putative membrane protein [Chloroflexi bacterium]|jgi:uncharacterized membrane protein|nr:MAG: putative membrane protein [Chloroflexota bacterium]
MTINDGLILAVRWLHILSAIIWVGGSLFYVLVVRPAISRYGAPSAEFRRGLGENFGSIVELCILTLLVTGAILAITRLTATYTGALYAIILALHVTLALWVFWLAWLRRRASQRRGWRAAIDLADEPPLPGRLGRVLTGTNTVAIAAVTVVMLSEVMRLIVERALDA